MSVWTDVIRGFQRLALLDDKVERALALAKEAHDHSIENRERIGHLETAMTFIVREQNLQRRLPPSSR